MEPMVFFFDFKDPNMKIQLETVSICQCVRQIHTGFNEQSTVGGWRRPIKGRTCGRISPDAALLVLVSRPHQRRFISALHRALSARPEITDVPCGVLRCYTGVSNFSQRRAYVLTPFGRHPRGREERKLCWPQTKSMGGRWRVKSGMQHGRAPKHVCVCVRTCVCIFRGLNCGCKTLMILCPFGPLTKWPARRSAGPHTSNTANHPMRLRENYMQP